MPISLLPGFLAAARCITSEHRVHKWDVYHWFFIT